MGHLTRSKVLLREINETYTSNVKLYVLGKKINFKNSIYKNKKLNLFQNYQINYLIVLKRF